MSADASPPRPGSVPAAPNLGTNLVTLAGVGLVVYGLMFLIRNFTSFIELGLTPEHIGGTPEQIRAFSPHLYNYISHLQVAVAAFVIALGLAVIALAWFGIRSGQRWALGAAFLAPVMAWDWPCRCTTSTASPRWAISA